VRNVISATKTAVVAALIAQKPDAPIARFIVLVIGTAEADFFAVLACETNVVFRVVIQSVMPISKMAIEARRVGSLSYLYCS
jgi:hypothetical protein